MACQQFFRPMDDVFASIYAMQLIRLISVDESSKRLKAGPRGQAELLRQGQMSSPVPNRGH